MKPQLDTQRHISTLFCVHEVASVHMVVSDTGDT